MHGHTRGPRLAAHIDVAGAPIPASAICCCCEDDAGRRFKSWMAAQASGLYSGGAREPFPVGRCAFCGKRVGKAPVKA